MKIKDQRSIGLDSDILSEKTKNILQHLSGKKELRLLSGLPKDMELKVRSVIAILDLNTSLPLPFADEYLKDLDVITLKERSTRYFGKDFVNDENISLSNCLFFEYNTLWNHYALEELKDIPNSRILKSKFFGVQILNEGCSCNKKFGVEKYYWGQLDKVPLLPRHLGCRCIYNAFREE